jgi:hypothetical protein
MARIAGLLGWLRGKLAVIPGLRKRPAKPATAHPISIAAAIQGFDQGAALDVETRHRQGLSPTRHAESESEQADKKLSVSHGSSSSVSETIGSMRGGTLQSETFRTWAA